MFVVGWGRFVVWIRVSEGVVDVDAVWDGMVEPICWSNDAAGQGWGLARCRKLRQVCQDHVERASVRSTPQGGDCGGAADKLLSGLAGVALGCWAMYEVGWVQGRWMCVSLLQATPSGWA